MEFSKRDVWLLVFCHVLCVHGESPTTDGGPRPIWNATYTDKLRQDLLQTYNKHARPSQHFNTTTVKFGVVITHVEIDEFKSTLNVYSWIRMVWYDDKLKWNASDYGGLEKINVADHEIWQPDIFVYNSATSVTMNHFTTHCIVFSSGEILWVPPTQYSVMCELNLKYWPFDTQVCSIIFGSWTYSGDQIDLQLYNNKTEAEILLLVNSTEWEIKGTTMARNIKYYDCCSEPYPDISVNITLARRSPSYKAIIITPAFAIIVLTLLNFWLPPQAGEKIILGGCTAIIISLFLLYFTQKIPAMGSHTPLVVFFYSSSLYVVCFSMIGSVIVIWISRTQHNTALPWAIKHLLITWLGKWLGLGYYVKQSSINANAQTAEEMRDHQVTDFEEQNTNDERQMIGSAQKIPLQYDWILLAAAIDRISFIFYSFLFAIFAISYAI